MENPPGTKTISGSQDQLGILLPGLNKLNYDNGYWPVSIDSVNEDKILDFVERNLWLIQLPPRKNGFDIFSGKNITESAVRQLAESAEKAWGALLACDAKELGVQMTRCFDAQVSLFPNTMTSEILAAVEQYRSIATGWKLTGAGGGGYLLLVSEREIPNAIKIHIRRAFL